LKFRAAANFKDQTSSNREVTGSRNSGVRSTPTGRASREDLRRNSRSVGSRGKSALYGGASEAKAEKTLVQGAGAL